MHRAFTFDVDQMQRDMAARGWTDVELARRAGVNKSSVSRFWSGVHRSAPMGHKLTRALGRPRGFYLLPAGAATLHVGA